MKTDTATDSPSQFAGLPRRLVAYVLDCLFLFAGVAAFHTAAYFSGWNPIINGSLALTSAALHGWVFSTVTLPILFYFWLLFQQGATLGMRVLRLRVCSTNLTTLTGAQALARASILLVPFELNHVLMFYLGPIGAETPLIIQLAYVVPGGLIVLYLVVSLLNEKRQSVHDFAAQSIVVKRPQGKQAV